MPIEKIPIVHKFGIISQSQRLELQERLLRQSSTSRESNIPVASKYPLEITDEFVRQFNTAIHLTEVEKLEAKAQKMLERAKRRVGLKEGGKGYHVDLPFAWTELSQLAQCKGKVQEDCLDILIASLDQAPMGKSQIPALFFLAETCLYWLRTDAINQPYLRTAELKILEMGYLVFVRLFYHHMAGQLQKHDDFKNRLFTYLDGFSECQEAYNPYPNALLCIRYINEVGKMIIGLAGALDPGEIKEGDPPGAAYEGGRGQPVESSKDSVGDGTDSLTISSHRRPANTEEDPESLFREVSVRYEDESTSSCPGGAGGAEMAGGGGGGLSSSVHDLSPTLWHALDVWRCTHQLSGGLSDALHALACCGTGLAGETWVDGICALHVLADAAKVNLSTLRVLQDLARGVPAPQTNGAHSHKGGSKGRKAKTGAAGTATTTTGSDSSDPTGQTSSRQGADTPGLSDIYEKTEDGGSSMPSRERLQQLESMDRDDDDGGRENNGVEEDMEEEELKLATTARSSKPPVTAGLQAEKTSSSFGGGGGGGRADEYSRNTTGWKAEVGSAAEDRRSQASSVPTYTNEVDERLAGLQGWHWEVAVTYTDLLADIALHGSTSNIQKVALVGNGSGGGDSRAQCPMKSAGLVDLVTFTAMKETDDGSHNDWSWRVRYTALRALVRLCQTLRDDATRDGLHTAAFSTVQRAQRTERDQRVLEALKVGQVDINLTKLLNTKVPEIAISAIGSRMAAGLAKLYLPALPPPVQSPPPKKISPSKKSSPPKASVPRTGTKSQPLRTSLKQEIDLATVLYEPPIPFNLKTDYDLKRMVEDQLRKEMQQQLEEEEALRNEELDVKQKQEEENERKTEESREVKMKNRFKPRAGSTKKPAVTSQLGAVKSYSYTSSVSSK